MTEAEKRLCDEFYRRTIASMYPVDRVSFEAGFEAGLLTVNRAAPTPREDSDE